MSKKRILTVGFQLASDQTDCAEFESKTSLLDWDVVLFKSQIMANFWAKDDYRGKPSFAEGTSFRLTESCAHWHREIKQAFDAGKTVITFAAKLEEVYVDTGERTHSGTGRNQKTTVHVERFDNYAAIPAVLSPVESSGSAMKLASRNASVLATYWEEFEADSRYQVIFGDRSVPDSIVTRTGEKTVGAIYRNKSSGGALLVLPDIDFYPDHFLKEDEGKSEWTPAAEAFAARMVATVVALDRTLRSHSARTPQPVWAAGDEFVLEPERLLRTRLLDVERSIEEAHQRKQELEENIRETGTYRSLLFEKGKPLEDAIVAALQRMGFSASSFRNSQSEFDAVFESEEGRFIGEAEGKDNRAVSVDKLRQLSMNVHEDLERQEVSSPAKPVLFGNAFRLKALADRGEPFTKKCQNAAMLSSTALVFTPDLFFIVKYLLCTDDQDYAKDCRRAVLDTIGRVTFPEPPDLVTPEQIVLDKGTAQF